MKDICYICLEETNNIYKSSCGCKLFIHQECLNNWNNINKKCMICKKEQILNNFFSEIDLIAQNNTMFLIKILNFVRVNEFFYLLSETMKNKAGYNTTLMYINLGLWIVFSFSIFSFIILPFLIINYILAFGFLSLIKGYDLFIKQLTLEAENYFLNRENEYHM